MTEFIPKYAGMTTGEITEKFRCDIDTALHQRYGDDPDAVIIKRVEDEWDALIHSGTLLDAATLYELTLWLRENRSPYWMNGCAGSSFLFYLLGMTFGNPLPPHRYCPKCHRVDWESYIFRDGFDLPDLSCESDGSPRIRDGHDIPYQMLWGYREFGEYQIKVVEPLVDPLLQILDLHWLRKSGAKPAQHEQLSTLIYYSNITIECFLDPLEIRPSFHDVEVTADDVDFALGEAGMLINEVFSEEHLEIPQPMDFADLLSSLGLREVLDEKTRILWELGYTASDLICFRDDVFRYLLDHGFSEEDAWKGMQECRKGRGLPIITDEMQKSRDKWVIDRCESILSLFPKAHALEYILFKMRASIL